MVYFKFNLFFAFLFLFASCNSETTANDRPHENNEIAIQLAENFGNDLSNWNLDAKVDISRSHGDSLMIHVFFSQKKMFYTSKRSNELILMNLIIRNRDSIERLPSCKVVFEFENVLDKATFQLDEKTFNAADSCFQNKLFFDNFNYCLEEFDSDNLVMFESILRFMANNSSIENVELDFWKILEGFSDFCATSNIDYINSASQFIVLTQMIRDAFSDVEGVPHWSKLEKLIELNGLNSNILENSFDQNMEYFHSLNE